MIVGVPKEIKADEYRVALTPAGAEMLVTAGHTVRIEKGAGIGSGFPDESYVSSGAEIVDAAADVWAGADMIMKVKEPIAKEWPLMRSGQVIFTYFHFAASEELTRAVIDSGAIAIAYETVELPSGELPLLTPMSEIAGRMAVQEGAKYLERPQGGLGVLLGGVPGVLPGKVLILGGGIVGTNAAKVAAGLGARVCIMDIDLVRLRYLDDVMPANVHTLFSTRSAIRQQVRDADVIIGAVLVTGAKAPKLITEDDLSLMRAGTVIVDVAVDQGGCVETIRPTTHQEPVYTVDGVMHYGVANMPGGVPRSSTFALTNATLPYALQLASKGWKRACVENAALDKGVNVVSGKVTHEAVAGAFGLDCTSVREAIASGPKMA
jgi:alanine dehydrogenase